MTNVYLPVSKSGNRINHITARSIVVLSNVSGHVKRLYRCKHVKAVCPSNVSKQNAFHVSSVSKLVKPLSVSKPVCSTIVSKSNICNASIVSQHVKPLNVNKSMSSCNVRNQNVHIANSISHHNESLTVGKSDCSCNLSKPVICKPSNISVCKIINNRQVFNLAHHSVVLNLRKRALKRSFNVSSHKSDVTKSLNVRNILMTSIYFYELVLLFFIFHHNFCSGIVDNFLKGYVTRNIFSRNNFLNYDSSVYHDVNIFNISHTNVLSLSSSDRFYPFSFYLCEYFFFTYSVLMIYFMQIILLIFLITTGT